MMRKKISLTIAVALVITLLTLLHQYDSKSECSQGLDVAFTAPPPLCGEVSGFPLPYVEVRSQAIMINGAVAFHNPSSIFGIPQIQKYNLVGFSIDMLFWSLVSFFFVALLLRKKNQSQKKG